MQRVCGRSQLTGDPVCPPQATRLRLDREALDAVNDCIIFGKRGPGGKDAPAVVHDKDLQKFVKDVLANTETAKEYGTHSDLCGVRCPSFVHHCGPAMLRRCRPPPTPHPPLHCRVQHPPSELSGTPSSSTLWQRLSSLTTFLLRVVVEVVVAAQALLRVLRAKAGRSRSSCPSVPPPPTWLLQSWTLPVRGLEPGSGVCPRVLCG